MSSAAGLFAMRYSGDRRASACLAGSSEGNGLSVIAITGWAMTSSNCGRLCVARRRDALSRKDLGIDDVRRPPALEHGEDVVDHDVRHLLAHLDHGAAEMRGEHDVGHLDELAGHLRLVLEHVEAGARDRAL